MTHIDCGADGWTHLAVVIDCHDREIVGHESARGGRAKGAERALEEACIDRFFRAACRDYRLRQEFITPLCEVARPVNTSGRSAPSCCSSFCPRCEAGSMSLRTFGFDSVGDAIYSNGSQLRPRRDSRSPTEDMTTESGSSIGGTRLVVWRPGVPEQSPVGRATSRTGCPRAELGAHSNATSTSSARKCGFSRGFPPGFSRAFPPGVTACVTG